MFWKHHIDVIANKLIRFSCILYKLKRFLPVHILRTLYFSLVQSQLTYGILAWGFEHQRFVKIQKRFIRIISLSSYNAHTEPWIKQWRILKINNLFDLNCLKFVYNYNKGELPSYFLDFRYEQRSPIHDHDTRFANLIDSKLIRTVMAQNCIRHHIVELHHQMYSRQNWHPQSTGLYILYQAISFRPNDFWMQFKTMLCM